ncbi:MAG: polysaccharide biosynthesis C-terminal domain-containing protein [Clostridia bacterium]|nr:polysaccharide biosynthesis C-terminal domain-containing protein [Clostridia bacterium]
MAVQNKYKTLLSNTAILGIGTFGSKLLVYFLMPLYTACLSSDQFGRADLIAQTANLLIPILSISIGDAVFRFTLDRAKNRAAILTTGFFILGAGALVGLPLGALLNCIPYFAGGYGWLIIAYTVASNFHTLCANYLRASGRTKLFALQGIFTTAFTVGLNLIFLLGLDMTVTGYVLSVVLADMIVGVALFFGCGLWKQVSVSAFSPEFAKKMLRYSAPLIPTTIFWWITNVSDRYMIAWFCGDDVNGLYAAAFKIPTLLILVSGIFIEAWHFSAVTDRGDARQQSRFFSTVFDSFQAVMFMAGAGLTAFAKVCAILLFDDSYYTAWQYMPVLLLATVFSSLVTFMGSVYLVEKKSLNSFYTSLIGALVNIVLNLILIPIWGAQGAAIATFTCYLVVFIIRAVNTQRYIRFNLHLRKLAVNTVLTAVQCVLMVAEPPVWWLWQGLIVVAVFAINAKPILRGIMQVLRRGK